MSVDGPALLAARPKAQARHSYAGTGNDSAHRSDMDEEELFFSSPTHPTSFTFAHSDEPSPTKRSRGASVEKLQKKFRPRDSGIVVDGDDSDDDFSPSRFHSGGAQLFTMSASSSLQSQSQSESDGEALVTPGAAPGPESGWPTVGVADGDDEFESDDPSTGVDAFILRTLTSGTKPPAPVPGEPQRIPGTPVKRIKTSHLVERPWQSAVTSKIGFPEFDEPRDASGKDKRPKPRKSLPAAFPGLAPHRSRKDAMHGLDLDTEDQEASPTTRKDPKALGLGRPPVPLFSKTADPKARTRWLMRRSSSGAFSSGSDTSRNVTPTRIPAKGKFCVRYHSRPGITFLLRLADSCDCATVSLVKDDGRHAFRQPRVDFLCGLRELDCNQLSDNGSRRPPLPQSVFSHIPQEISSCQRPSPFTSTRDDLPWLRHSRTAVDTQR